MFFVVFLVFYDSKLKTLSALGCFHANVSLFPDVSLTKQLLRKLSQTYRHTASHILFSTTHTFKIILYTCNGGGNVLA